MMALSRALWFIVLTLSLVAPAAADVTLDVQCNTAWNTMRAEAKQCGASGGVVPSADVQRCLSAHAGDFGQTATVCVNAAQSRYAAASTLQGYQAASALMGAATFLGDAAEANIYLQRRDLANTQLTSVISLASKVKADPSAGNLAGTAAGELAVAKHLQSVLASH